jgi:hypothetical protein
VNADMWGAWPKWEPDEKTHSFEIPEELCGGFGLLVAVAFLTSFFGTLGALYLFL